MPGILGGMPGSDGGIPGRPGGMPGNPGMGMKGIGGIGMCIGGGPGGGADDWT